MCGQDTDLNFNITDTGEEVDCGWDTIGNDFVTQIIICVFVIGCVPDIRIPKPETRNSKSETQIPKSETRNPKSETLISNAETRNPNSEFRNTKPEFRNSKLETRNPKPETRNHESNPEPGSLNLGHRFLLYRTVEFDLFTKSQLASRH